MDIANAWDEYRGIERKPGLHAKKSPWDRTKAFFIDAFVKPKWAPWRKEGSGTSAEVGKLIEDDAREIYTNFSGRDDFGPKLFMEKMKDKGWSDEAIKKLGQKTR